MKKMKKLVSLLLTVVMVFAMTTIVFATNITIGGGATDSVYSAYRLLNATDGGNGKYAYTINPKYENILSEVTTKTTETDIVSYIANLNGNEIRNFANAVYEKIADASSNIEADETSLNSVFSNVKQGYYLIAETVLGDEQDTFSLVMLDTAGQDNVDVTTKEDKPTLNKQIKHNESDQWGVVGDNQIGDTVEFRTITTVPNFTSEYTQYDYIIHDTMSTGLTSNVVTDNINSNVKVKINDSTELEASYFNVTATENTFSVSIDVKRAVADGKMAQGDKLYTYYSGVLNNEALIYDVGNQDNEAYLEYSNNPYDIYDTAETPKVKVYDWTFKMGVNKVDGSTDETITGARFVLSESVLDLDDLQLNDGVPSATDYLIGLVNEGNNIYRVATDNDSDAVYYIEAGNITIKGLDDATSYYLYETKAPDGYNMLKDPVKFEIKSEYVEDGSAVQTDYPTVIVGTESPSTTLSTNIENNSGTELPTTGGIGTTIFYVLGSILVIAAAILLITRKRMSAEK